MPFHLFYNDAVNQEVNLKEDYRRWKAGGADDFSFCEHAYVLEPASKSRVLMHDSTAQAPSPRQVILRRIATTLNRLPGS